MFKRFLLFFIVVMLINVLSSCKKDSSGSPVIPGVTTSMTAKVNGIDWISLVRVCNKTANSITLTGTSLDGKIIEINISPNITTESLTVNKDYTIPITSFYKASATTSTDDIYFASPLGLSSVKLTQLDLTNKLISGTFNFTGVSVNLGMIAITSGVFTSLSYVGN